MIIASSSICKGLFAQYCCISKNIVIMMKVDTMIKERDCYWGGHKQYCYTINSKHTYVACVYIATLLNTISYEYKLLLIN